MGGSINLLIRTCMELLMHGYDHRGAVPEPSRVLASRANMCCKKEIDKVVHEWRNNRPVLAGRMTRETSGATSLDACFISISIHRQLTTFTARPRTTIQGRQLRGIHIPHMLPGSLAQNGSCLVQEVSKELRKRKTISLPASKAECGLASTSGKILWSQVLRKIGQHQKTPTTYDFTARPRTIIEECGVYIPLCRTRVASAKGRLSAALSCVEG